MMRTTRSTLTFTRTFRLDSGGRLFPAGDYELVMDEELLEGLSFPAYRRVATWILTPAVNSNNPTEMIVIDPVELAAAHVHDLVCTESEHTASPIAKIG